MRHLHKIHRILFLLPIFLSVFDQILAKTTAEWNKENDPKWPQNYPGGPTNFSNDSDEHFRRNGRFGQRKRDENENPRQNEEDREKEKWPQNYPGGAAAGDNEGPSSRGPFFPGHIGHWPGKSDWEDEQNGQNRREGGHRRHGHRSNEEDEERHRSSWLDWLMPWRRRHHHHEDKESHPYHHHNKMPWQHDDNNSSGSREESKEEEEENNDENEPNFNNSTEKIDGKEMSENGTKTVVIRIGGGPVKGMVSYLAGEDRPAYVFKGVPFAEPPLGKLRFAPLRKKKPWRNQLLDATKYKAACLSNTTRTRSPQHYISEDCIYVNVFADPKCRKQKPCPVLFYVHGGGFAYDSATMFNDSQIIRKYASDGVVFMIPAYRLGIFGFLDLGADKPVKRNMGMHDIIFALEWARKEAHNFGGDPKKITVMGNSAGASAVGYLCSSPAVKKDAFQQAIISSGVPTLIPNANLKQSYAILEHFNCLVNNKTNRTLSAREKVECLRRIDSLDLLREQQRNEGRGIVFAGPEMDTELLPEKSYAALLKHWRPISLLYSTTSHEFSKRWGTNYLDNECRKGLTPFGYYSQRAYNACIARYNRTFDQEYHMRVSYESMHAESFLTSLVNTRLGGISYVGEFELANYSNHADDLYFFFGLHYIPLNTSDVKLMDIYYPKMIKNFLNGHAPDKDWKPQNWNGRNYFRISFNVSDNGTLLEYPHNVDGYQDIKGLNFWLHDLAIVERNARQEAKEAKENQSRSEDKAWEDVFGDGQNENENRAKERPERAFNPFSSFMALPPMTEGNGTQNGTNSSINSTAQDAILPLNIDGNNQTIESVELPLANEILPNESATMAPLNEGKNDNGELSRVWSAFWLTMTITTMLAVALFMLALTKVVYRFKNVRGYHPAGGPNENGNGGGMFTEKTRIIQANGNNSMRYI